MHIFHVVPPNAAPVEASSANLVKQRIGTIKAATLPFLAAFIAHSSRRGTSKWCSRDSA